MGWKMASPTDGADLEASLLSFEKLDRASPDLWPEQLPGVAEFAASFKSIEDFLIFGSSLNLLLCQRMLLPDYCFKQFSWRLSPVLNFNLLLALHPNGWLK
ncbi:protein lin-52 homolog isoform X6 [Tursiops truncatus]|uniref:protein lin-52 homolog isoform X6 n=1 Tax=Tursiops truncatus TaxID=9739 RepID=UPI003CCF8B96